ncbi:DUF4278 domain-containing protein [Gloeocapsa sp. PCC 73106]|uniref:DUF4278 domain-containing protein n=1 Tax=Gloeocapsa sp. PCC 73106 TaxID=102232 RepID=UPI0002ACD33A|nr:DUF4278 domain-containing protein [Gloeocapsa sp. PCC 73106]ELR99835.1 hypothetical protein GLO73106DRAFT_00036870 [Gloeocapsa sp. PCC 73106]
MQLTYRGATYEYNPTVVETTATTVGGKYRGLDWRFRNLKKPPILQPVNNLTYRGVSYNKPGTPSVKPRVSMQEKARCLMINQAKHDRNRQQTMLNRASAEIGLVH